MVSILRCEDYYSHRHKRLENCVIQLHFQICDLLV